MAEGRRAKQLTSCGWAAERSGKKRSQRLTLPTSLHFHSAPPPTSLSQLFLNVFFFLKKNGSVLCICMWEHVHVSKHLLEEVGFPEPGLWAAASLLTW